MALLWRSDDRPVGIAREDVLELPCIALGTAAETDPQTFVFVYGERTALVTVLTVVVVGKRA